MAAVAGTRSSFAVVLPSVSQQVGASIATSALAFTVHWIVFTASAPLAWRVFVRIGSVRMFQIGGVLCGGGFALLATVDAPWQTVLWFGVVVGVGTHGIGQLASNHAVLVTSGAARRNQRFGIVASGSPIGTAFLPALAAIGTAWWGWRTATAVVGAVVVILTWVAAQVVGSLAVVADGRRHEATVRDSSLWIDTAFIFLAVAFFLGLLVQVSVPFIIPLWGAHIGLSAGQVAAGFLVFGVSGLVGRLVLTSLRSAFSLQLWVAAPAALLAAAGCVMAIGAHREPWFLAALALVGASTAVFGALFVIAAVACFPKERYAQVVGSLLFSVGVGAALAPALPVAFVARGLSFDLLWGVLAAMAAATAVLLVVAEVSSHRTQSRRVSAPGGQGIFGKRAGH